jgi:hypothetical protein
MLGYFLIFHVWINIAWSPTQSWRLTEFPDCGNEDDKRSKPLPAHKVHENWRKDWTTTTLITDNHGIVTPHL